MIRLALHLPFGIELRIELHRGFDPADIAAAAWTQAWREPPYDDEDEAVHDDDCECS
ncbi:hypothetical protein [Nocardia acidivorans]|uniref:hypothetical protein n=1 Tax=Nocardia acidivorans TaxID=404580 RepID=UPI000A7FF55B|nr:hypothetical protein [Nocardia acidivorans]